MIDQRILDNPQDYAGKWIKGFGSCERVLFIGLDGQSAVVRNANYEYQSTSYARPIEPRYRTPTDEDAKKRPMCEFRVHESDEWKQYTLISVDDGNSTKFMARGNDNQRRFFSFARILDENGVS